MTTDSIPKISILMTAYNREQYIGEAIESVLTSSFRDFELIIVDDGSTDNTFRIAESFQHKDDRIRLYRNENNLGQFANRNKAMSLATGTYIKFVDSDDKISTETLAVMISAMERFPAAGIGVPAEQTDKNIPYCLNAHDSIFSQYNGFDHLSHGPTATIFKKEAVLRTAGYEPKYGVNADILFNLRIASLSSTVFIKPGMYFWRRHEGQEIGGMQDKVRMIKEKYLILSAVLNSPDIPLSKAEVDQIKKKFERINSIHYIRYFLKGSFGHAAEIKKTTEISLARLIKSFFR